MTSRIAGTRNPAQKGQLRNNPKNQVSANTKDSRKSKRKRAPKRRSSIPVDIRRIVKTDKSVISYVLDTNVLISSWDAMFKFEEHDVILVSQVWKELDNQKKGFSEEAWNTRKAIRTIDELVAGKTTKELKSGIPLIPPKGMENGLSHTGKLFFDFSSPKIPEGCDVDLSLNEPDDRIIMICLKLKKDGKRVVLISNDGNCRVKANCAGIESEEYLNEAVTGLIGEEDIRKGFHVMPKGIWEKVSDGLKAKPSGKIFKYRMKHERFSDVYVNEFLIFPDGLNLIVTGKPTKKEVVAETFEDYTKHKISGITPRNTEQELALHLLMDERISCVSIAGLAGSGKNYLAIGAAMSLAFDLRLYNRIVITRATVGSDEDIGYLPGTEEEKMNPWMGALHDNLESFVEKPFDKQANDEDISIQENEAAIEILKKRMQIKALNFMKGRTFNRTIMIVDETQDLTVKKLKMIATRVGPGSKIIFLGNVAQIDDSYLTEHTCGLSVLIRTFADSKLAGHITLQRGERSSFATEAEERL